MATRGTNTYADPFQTDVDDLDLTNRASKDKAGFIAGIQVVDGAGSPIRNRNWVAAGIDLQENNISNL